MIYDALHVNCHGKSFIEFIYLSNGEESPSRISRQNLLDNNKQVILYIEAPFKNRNYNLSKIAFYSLGSISRLYETRIAIDNWKKYLSVWDLLLFGNFLESTLHNLFEKYYKVIHPDDISNLIVKNNVLSLDWLRKDDTRRESFIWSWGQGEPNNAGNKENCAEINKQKINDAPCEKVQQALCYDEVHKEFIMTHNSHDWASSFESCKQMGYEFTVPKSAQQMKAANNILGYHTARLNYHRNPYSKNWEADFKL
ncbi:hypothetical protein OAT97_00115 [Gammaproteobacteria bacterium]|nr:hypothetical protein [Gammaproteobacteria bacterium]